MKNRTRLFKSKSFSSINELYAKSSPESPRLHLETEPEAGEIHELHLNAMLNPTTLSVDEKNKEVIYVQEKQHPTAQAEAMAASLGPRVKNITNKLAKNKFLYPEYNDTLSHANTGCGGDVGEGQNSVADLLDWFIKNHPELNIISVVNLGDNFYSKGVASPLHKDFQEKFYDPYFAEKRSHARRVPWWMIPGNHDANCRKVENALQKVRGLYMPLYYGINLVKTIDTSVPPTGHDAEINQTAHTYYLHPEDPHIGMSKWRLYNQNEIDVSQSSAFDMEYYNTSKIVGDKFQYFFVDSNSLLNDYLDYLNHITGIKPLSEEQLKKNQAYFLMTEYEKCDKIPILVQHHPFMALNKRAYQNEYDSSHYMDHIDVKRLDLILQIPRYPEKEFVAKVLEILRCSPEDIDKIPSAPHPTVDAENYCTMLARFYASQNMYFKLLICAHDHMLGYISAEGFENVSMNYRPDNKQKLFITKNRPDDLRHYPFSQMTSGGGGGELQERKWFRQSKDVGAVAEENGLFVTTLNPKTGEIDIHFLTVLEKQMVNGQEVVQPGTHIRFVAGSSEPIIQKVPIKEDIVEGVKIKRPPSYIPPVSRVLADNERYANQLSTETIKIDELRRIVVQACKAYQDFLDAKMGTSGNFFNRNTKHFQSDIKIMHKMQNFVNQFKPRSYTDTIENLYALSQKLINGGKTNNMVTKVTGLFKSKPTHGSVHAFIRTINELLMESPILGRKDLETLHYEITHKKTTVLRK